MQEKLMIDMLLIVGYVVLLMVALGFAMFLNYHSKKVDKLERAVSFYKSKSLALNNKLRQVGIEISDEASA